jgi:hypothetical protein
VPHKPKNQGKNYLKLTPNPSKEQQVKQANSPKQVRAQTSSLKNESPQTAISK